MYTEDDFLTISGIQHFAFCRRQWALIHIEQAWEENLLTMQGNLMHQRAHDDGLHERRGDTLIVRGLAIHSSVLGLSGKCDVVEFHKNAKGHPLVGEDGLWREVPVEYKRGSSKTSDADRLQLCAQALCLEEMLGSDVPHGYLFYGKTKTREEVKFGAELRQNVADMVEEMHRLYKKSYTPRIKPFSACRSCSLHEICLPKATAISSVESYMTSRLKEQR